MDTTQDKFPRLNDEFGDFTGTSTYYQHWVPGFYYTDGIKALADEYGAYWLIDYVVSYQREPIFQETEFQVWNFTVCDNSAIVQITDGNEDPICPDKKIPFTDLPDCTLTIWISRADNVILLPSEY